jgi:hypothetical protein
MGRTDMNLQRILSISILALSLLNVMRASSAFVIHASLDTYSVGDVLAHIAKKAGVIIVAGSSIARERVPMPASGANINGDTVEQYIRSVMKSLPEGTILAKIYLPGPPSGKEWAGDDVIAFALAQAKLYGIVGAPRDDDKVEILSQLLPPEKAKDVIAALNLKPVYVIAAGKGTFTGVWNTTYGEMILRQSGRRVTGTYTFGKGEIEGTVIGDTLRFHWIERETGSAGPGEFTLSKDGESFSGPWGYDSQPDSPPGEWTGQRVSPRSYRL